MLYHYIILFSIASFSFEQNHKILSFASRLSFQLVWKLLITARQRSCGKVLFSVMSVILSVGGEASPCDHTACDVMPLLSHSSQAPSPDIFKIVYLGDSPDVFKLVYYIAHKSVSKRGRWHSTEMPSCLNFNIDRCVDLVLFQERTDIFERLPVDSTYKRLLLI